MRSLLELRSSTKLTQKEFAKRFHIPFRTYQNWELYEKDPENKQGRRVPEYVSFMLNELLRKEE